MTIMVTGEIAECARLNKSNRAINFLNEKKMTNAPVEIKKWLVLCGISSKIAVLNMFK